MKRRIAAPDERCEKELGQQAIWKAKRLGRPVEERCSRKRVSGSPYCVWHQPNRVETKRRLSNEQVVAIYAEVVRLRLEYGVPPIGQMWWGGEHSDRLDLRLVLPSMPEFARLHGISTSAFSDLLRGKQYTAIGNLRDRTGWWSIADVVAALLWLRREYGGIPAADGYRALKRLHPQLPSTQSLRRIFSRWSRISFVTGIPSTAVMREWTPEEEEYLAEHIGLLSAEAIAATLGRTKCAVLEKSRERGDTIYTAQGYVTLAEAVRSYGAPFHQLRNAALSGRVPFVRGAHGTRRILFFEPEVIEAWLERRRGGLLMAGGSE